MRSANRASTTSKSSARRPDFAAGLVRHRPGEFGGKDPAEVFVADVDEERIHDAGVLPSAFREFSPIHKKRPPSGAVATDTH